MTILALYLFVMALVGNAWGICPGQALAPSGLAVPHEYATLRSHRGGRADSRDAGRSVPNI